MGRVRAAEKVEGGWGGERDLFYKNSDMLVAFWTQRGRDCLLRTILSGFSGKELSYLGYLAKES